MKNLIKSLIYLVPCVLLVWVGFTFLDLDGTTNVSWRPGQSSPFIHGLRPSARAELRGGNIVIGGDPVYLSVSPPGNYQSAEITMWLDPGDQPLVELGATVNAAAGQIDLRPVVHQTLEQLSDEWASYEVDDVMVLRRGETASSLQDVLTDPSELASIATYRYQFPEDGTPSRAWTGRGHLDQASVSLRGFHEFVTATDGRDLDLTLEYMDMNRNIGPDPVSVRVYQFDELVAETELEDDGDERATNVGTGRRNISVRASNLKAGIVKVELNAGTDIYWRELHSSLPKASFLSNITIGDEIGYLPDERSVTFWTDAEHLTLHTRHAEGVQVVEYGSKTIDIAVPGERYQIENPTTELMKVVVPRGDLVVVTDGRIAFNESAFFNPFPARLDDRLDVDARGINTVVAEYTSPERDGGWLKSSTTFELGPLERESAETIDGDAREANTGSYRFVVSMPHISDRGAEVTIHRIDVKFMRPPRTLGDVFRLLKKRLTFVTGSGPESGIF